MADRLTDAVFHTLVEEAPDAIVLVDGAGLILYVNAQTERLFGYARSELQGQRVELLVPEDQRAMHVIHREVYQERPERRPMGIGLELVGRRKDGSTLPVEISLSPFTDGAEQRSVAVLRDVTRQRRAEEALRRSEERHRLLNERAESIIFRYRLAPVPGFEYISAAVTKSLEYAPEEFYVDEELILRIAHPNDRHVMAQALSPAAASNVSLRLVTRGGAVRWFELSITAVQSPEGALVALEGIARDVTERRAADEERVHLESEIEMQLERSRIAGDLHDDTIQSIYALGLGLHAIRDDAGVSKEAAVDRAIGELNAVIAALRAYMQRLSGEGEGAREREPFETRIAGLIDRAGAVQWSVAIEPGLSLDPALERQLYLLAKELVSNVQRHAQARSAALTLQRDDGRVELVVRDDGTGFNRQTIRPDAFGLRSVELRASTLAAELEVDSTPGSGTRVRVSVPLATAAAAGSSTK